MTWNEFYARCDGLHKKWPDLANLNKKSGITLRQTMVDQSFYKGSWIDEETGEYSLTADDYLTDLTEVATEFKNAGFKVRCYKGDTPYGTLPVRVLFTNYRLGSRVVNTYTFE